MVHVKPEVIEVSKEGESTVEKFANSRNFGDLRNDRVGKGEIEH